jgi:hypothetical protein
MFGSVTPNSSGVPAGAAGGGTWWTIQDTCGSQPARASASNQLAARGTR